MRRVQLLLLGILVLIASACRVDTTIDIAVDNDGSGVVTVTVVADAAAVEALPDAPDSLRFEDLAAAGWTVDGPDIDAAGAMRIAFSKPFVNADALPPVLAEIVGEGVLFEDVVLETTHSFDRIGLGPATTHYTLSGTLDPNPDLASFSDDLLPPSVGIDTREALIDEQRNGDDRIIVRVRLPDSESSDTGEAVGEAVVWETRFGATESVVLDARSSTDDILPRVWAIVALLALLFFVAILLSRLAGFVLAILRTPKGRRRRDVRRRQQNAATRAEEASRPRRRMLRLLVVDVHGVVVRPTDPLEGLLLPLITAEHPDVDATRVRELHRRLVLGRISVEEFWAEVGLGPVAEGIETKYLSSFRLVPGLHPFLDRMATSGLPVAAIGNQPRAWGDRLRRMAALDDALASWMVSGDVGSTLPEPALFEATRRTMSVDLFDCFYLSNVAEHLDAAEAMGMATGLFVAGDEVAPETTHTVVRGFEDLLRSRSG
jgi:FMN phosphatase YigB (HAD superfamily)